MTEIAGQDESCPRSGSAVDTEAVPRGEQTTMQALLRRPDPELPAVREGDL